jgi:hypothetical protein
MIGWYARYRTFEPRIFRVMSGSDIAGAAKCGSLCPRIIVSRPMSLNEQTSGAQPRAPLAVHLVHERLCQKCVVHRFDASRDFGISIRLQFAAIA